MSRRYAATSALLLLSVFLPWFGVDVLVVKLTIHGYQLHIATYVLLLLGVIGFVGSFIKQARFRGLTQGVVGVLSVITIWVANTMFYSQISKRVMELLGGASSMFGSSGSSPLDSINPNQVTSYISNTQFGFYVAIVAALATAGFGFQAVLTRTSDPLLPEKWDLTVLRGNMEQLSNGFVQTASTVQSQVQTRANKVDWSQWSWKTTRGKSVISGISILVVYFIGMAVYNSTHSLNASVKSLVQGVKDKNVGLAASLVDAGKLNPQAIPGFVDYYSQHMSDLEGLLSPLDAQLSLASDSSMNPTTNSALGSLFSNTDSSTVHLVKHSFLGYSSYKIFIPPVAVKLSGPTGTSPSFAIDGKSVASTVNLLPAQYNIAATVKTPLGDVSQSQKVDTSTTSDVKFDFAQNLITAASPDLSNASQVTYFVNGKQIPGSISPDPASFNGGVNVTIGPIPKPEGAAISVVATLPWGKFTEAGTVQNGQTQLQVDTQSDSDTFTTIANVINSFNHENAKDMKTGDYASELQYLWPNGSMYSSVSGQSGTQDSTYNGMVISPQMQLTKLQDGNIGLAVNDSEFYTNQSFFGSMDQENDWTYTMEFDTSKKTWLIVSEDGSGQSIQKGSPNLELK